MGREQWKENMNARTIRSSAALALGKLSALSTRIDSLIGDLMTSFQAADTGMREAILSAMRGVIKHAGKSIGPAVRVRIFDLLKDLMHNDDDQVRISATSMLGVLSQYLEAAQISLLLQEVRDLSTSQKWTARHGSVLCIASLLKHNPSTIMTSPLFSSILNSLKTSLKDEKFPLRETSTKALGRILLHQLATDPSNTRVVTDILSSIVSALHDDSSEVRRRALSSLKAFAKANPAATVANMSVIEPPLAECVKDGSTPVRLAGERCALHVFQLTKGAENVQAAQKYMSWAILIGVGAGKSVGLMLRLLLRNQRAQRQFAARVKLNQTHLQRGYLLFQPKLCLLEPLNH